MARGRFRGDYARWEKAPGNPVCEVDLAADAMLRERLTALDGEAGWLSEETADSAERLLTSKAWVVDPIDGTRDYIRGRSGWAVSVALVEGGKVSSGSVLKWDGESIMGVARADLPGLIDETTAVDPGGHGLRALDYFMGNRTPHRDATLRGAVHALAKGRGRRLAKLAEKRD